MDESSVEFFPFLHSIEWDWWSSGFLCITRRHKESWRRWWLNFNKMEFQQFLKITRICRNFFFLSRYHSALSYLLSLIHHKQPVDTYKCAHTTHNSWNHCEFCNFSRCSGNSEKNVFFIILEWYCIFLREHTQTIYEKFSNIYFVNHNYSLFQHTVQKRDIPVNKNPTYSGVVKTTKWKTIKTTDRTETREMRENTSN